MARRKASDNGSTAVLEPPEEQEEQTAGEEAIPANLEPEDSASSAEVNPDAPVQGPILEPEQIEVYEHEHGK